MIAFPVAYWIAFYGGRRKNFFLLMLLVPFFVSFVIRTLAWQFILSDQGLILQPLKKLGLVPENYHVLATWIAVIAGIAYNFLPFTALPLYVALERIDRRVVEASRRPLLEPNERVPAASSCRWRSPASSRRSC